MYSVGFSRAQEYFMMSHELPRGKSFWSFLLSVDRDLAEATRHDGTGARNVRVFSTLEGTVRSFRVSFRRAQI
jgi:hypothetical protein